MLFNSQNTSKPQSLRNRSILELTYATGMRVSELRRLKIEDIDRQRKVVSIVQGKGRKDGMTLYGDEAARCLEKYLDVRESFFVTKSSPDNVFLTRDGEAFVKTGFSALFRGIRKASGIKSMGGFHLIRHTFAQHMLENGMDSRYICEMLRHESLETTKKYLGLDTSHLRTVFDQHFEKVHPHA